MASFFFFFLFSHQSQHFSPHCYSMLFMLRSITENSAFVKMDSRRDTKRGGKPKTKPPHHISVGPRFFFAHFSLRHLRSLFAEQHRRHESRRAVQRLTTALMPALTYAAIARSALLFAAALSSSPPHPCALHGGGGTHSSSSISSSSRLSFYSHAWLKREVRDFG